MLVHLDPKFLPRFDLDFESGLSYCLHNSITILIRQYLLLSSDEILPTFKLIRL